MELLSEVPGPLGRRRELLWVSGYEVTALFLILRLLLSAGWGCPLYLYCHSQNGCVGTGQGSRQQPALMDARWRLRNHLGGSTLLTPTPQEGQQGEGRGTQAKRETR
jgi:hypothetical protein